jgi:hypothetical protein
MKQARSLFIVLAIVSSSFSGLRLCYNVGGTVASLGYKFSDTLNISVTDQNARKMILFGAAAEIDYKEMFGFTFGMQLEDRGGTLIGNMVVPLFGRIDAELDFRYRFLQFPIQAKFIVPLLIPGNVYLSAGPELGFLIDNSYTICDTNGSPVFISNIDSLTSKIDFGISGTLGYELPLGRYFALSFWGSYYYGFTDLYEKKDDPAADFDLNNRAIRFGISFISTLKEF